MSGSLNSTKNKLSIPDTLSNRAAHIQLTVDNICSDAINTPSCYRIAAFCNRSDVRLLEKSLARTQSMDMKAGGREEAMHGCFDIKYLLP